MWICSEVRFLSIDQHVGQFLVHQLLTNMKTLNQPVGWSWVLSVEFFMLDPGKTAEYSCAFGILYKATELEVDFFFQRKHGNAFSFHPRTKPSCWCIWQKMWKSLAFRREQCPEMCTFCIVFYHFLPLLLLALMHSLHFEMKEIFPIF